MHIRQLNRIANANETEATEIMRKLSEKTLNDILMSDNANDAVLEIAENLLDRAEFETEYNETIFRESDFTAKDSYTNVYDV